MRKIERMNMADLCLNTRQGPRQQFRRNHASLNCTEEKGIPTFVPASGMSFERQAVMRPLVIDAVNIERTTVPKSIQTIATKRPPIVFGHKSPYL